MGRIRIVARALRAWVPASSLTAVTVACGSYEASGGTGGSTGSFLGGSTSSGGEGGSASLGTEGVLSANSSPPNSGTIPAGRAALKRPRSMGNLRPTRCSRSPVLAPDVIRARSRRDPVVMMEPTEDRPRDDPPRIRAGCRW